MSEESKSYDLNEQITAAGFDNPKRFLEIKGVPGVMIQGAIVPNFGGKTTVKIERDVLHESAQVGSDKRETFTRIQSVDYVGIYASSIGALLIVALFVFVCGLLLLGSTEPQYARLGSWTIGASIIIAGIYSVVKYRYLQIDSPRNTVIVFLTRPPYEYRQFIVTVLDIARELNHTDRYTLDRPAKKRPSVPPPPPSHG